MNFRTAVLALAAFAVTAGLAFGQIWNPLVANTSGGCPAVMTQSNGLVALQCTMANAMVGIDPSTPPVDANGASTDPSKILTWKTTFRYFNRDIVAHTGTYETFLPDGSAPYWATYTFPSGSIGATYGQEGGGMAPLGSGRAIFTGATPTTIASPFAVTLLAAQSTVDQLPDLVGETLVQQVDTNGNIRQSYAVADRATVTNASGTAFGVQMDVGYPNQDTALIISNPDPSALATVTVALWNGANDTADYAVRQKEVYATATISVAPGTSVSKTVSDLFSIDSNYQSFLAGTTPSGATPGTGTLAVITSDVPVGVGAVHIDINPDRSVVRTMGYAFPLIPTNQATAAAQGSSLVIGGR